MHFMRQKKKSKKKQQKKTPVDMLDHMQKRLHCIHHWAVDRVTPAGLARLDT